jgi:hypothetical protein
VDIKPLTDFKALTDLKLLKLLKYLKLLTDLKPLKPLKIMKLKLQRRFRAETYTIGSLYIDGKYFCDTLEDKDRALKQSMPLSEIKKIKIMHQTAIPTGAYSVIVNMSPSKLRILPRLQNVPGFDGILIHRGNTAGDSSGCILLGENKVKGKVINSTGYETKLVELLITAQAKSEEITVEIT